MAVIRTASDAYVPAGRPDLGARSVIELLRAHGHQVPEPVGDAPAGPPVTARVNHGRWIADCECGSAAYAHPTDRRFFCVECGNARHGGRWRPVAWPADRVAVERALAGRPAAEQNWQPAAEHVQDGG